MKIFGFAGYSGSGKTTLIKKMIKAFSADGLRVSSIKFAHHDIEVDQPGKDSWQLRQAGCEEVLLVSGSRWVLFHEIGPQQTLTDSLARLQPCDLVLIEGCRDERLPKLELWRPGVHENLRWKNDLDVVGIVAPQRFDTHLPQFHPDQIAEIADFVHQQAKEVNECC